MIALARDGVFWTIQGEGHLSGKGMVFIRLAGCSVGCALCDTDYAVAGRREVVHLTADVHAAFPGGVTDKWVWITGGEPTDQPEIDALVRQLAVRGYNVAVATSGKRRVLAPVSWLSVSPHTPDFVQLYGNEVKVVPGLNGHGVEELCAAADRGDWWERFVMPLWDAKAEREDPTSLADCLAWVKHNPRWGITRQNHKAWGLR